MNTDMILRVLKKRASVLECAALWRFASHLSLEQRQKAAAVQDLAESFSRLSDADTIFV
jgi:hypothetical protein